MVPGSQNRLSIFREESLAVQLLVYDSLHGKVYYLVLWLASPQIAGSLMKISANKNQSFWHELEVGGGGGGVPTMMTSLWKLASKI